MNEKSENFLAKCLLEAIEDENMANVKILIFKHKANPSRIDPERGIAAIHFAAGMDNLPFSEKVMILLLKNNGDPNVQTIDGETPLHVAASWNRKFIVEMLLDHGADHSIEDDEHNTAINCAILEGHHGLVEVFKRHVFEKKLEGRHPANVRIEKERTPTKQLQQAMKKTQFLEPPSTTEPTDSIYTPNRKHYNFDVSSPYYINITHRRKNAPAKDYSDSFSRVNSDPISVDPLITSQARSQECTAPESVTIKTETQQTDDGTNTDTYSGSNETVIFKGNLFQLTEENLSKHLEGFKKVNRVSLVDSWRKKVHRTETRKSLLPNDEAELDSFISQFTSSLVSTQTSTPFCNHPTFIVAEGNLEVNGGAPVHSESFVTANDEESIVELKKLMKSPNNKATMIQVENFVHTDAESDIVFYETKYLPGPRSSATGEAPDLNDSAYTASSNPSTEITIPLEYDTDDLRRELTMFGDSPKGPITKTTKRLYLKKLVKYKRQTTAIVVNNGGNNHPKFSIELERTLRPENKAKWQDFVNEYKPLEAKMSEGFLNDNQAKRFREGNLKTSFIYMLIDPRVSENLPVEAQTISKYDAWQRFLASIFYVGKGKSSRPYAHLYDAIKFHQGTQVDAPNSKQSDCAKLERIINIWKSGKGVVCLPIFHHILPVEAYTREAAIIDCIGLQNLTNLKRGDYYGHSLSWTMRQRKQLGVLLLYKAMHIFLMQGESQLRPDDIKKD